MRKFFLLKFDSDFISQYNLEECFLGEKIFIEIEDNGIGMTSKQVKQLGTPYYSTKDKGTGIGLTLVYRIIRDMKGEISVVSKKGQGTTFRIALLKTIV